METRRVRMVETELGLLVEPADGGDKPGDLGGYLTVVESTASAAIWKAGVSRGETFTPGQGYPHVPFMVVRLLAAGEAEIVYRTDQSLDHARAERDARREFDRLRNS